MTRVSAGLGCSPHKQTPRCLVVGGAHLALLLRSITGRRVLRLAPPMGLQTEYMDVTYTRSCGMSIVNGHWLNVCAPISQSLAALLAMKPPCLLSPVCPSNPLFPEGPSPWPRTSPPTLDYPDPRTTPSPTCERGTYPFPQPLSSRVRAGQRRLPCGNGEVACSVVTQCVPHQGQVTVRAGGRLLKSIPSSHHFCL